MSETFQDTARYNFKTIRRGATFTSRSLTIQEASGTTLVSAELIFTAGGATASALTKSSGSGLTLTSTEAGNWIVTIEQFDVALAEDVYSYELWTVDSANRRWCYLAGNMKVI